MVYVLFAIGFVALIYGANWLVDGSSSIAKKFNISNAVIGLTVVSFGTSAPELAVNVIASISDNNDIAIGNVVGSNIANVFFILGVCAVIAPLRVSRYTVWMEIPISLFAALILGFTINDSLFETGHADAITRTDGAIYLVCFAFFMLYAMWISRRTNETTAEVPAVQYPMWKSIVMVIGGLVGLTLGGKWIVDGAVEIATVLGMSQAVIGLTIVAIGTSLPELAASAVAVYKGNSDLAIGNVIGSNIFNTFWILGLSSTISPMPYKGGEQISIILNIVASALLFAFLFIGKRHTLQKWQGAAFILGYAVYITFLVMQGRVE